MRRFFTRRQKIAAQAIAGRLGEADHVIPYSQGGATDMSNVQILSPAANRAKGAFHFKPREWQSRFFERWDNRTSGDPFMLIAVPGAGKTMAALHVAREWVMANQHRRRLFIVGSTRNIIDQWQADGAKFGLNIQVDSFTGCREDYHGHAMTYQLVTMRANPLQHWCSHYDAMVILDEVHHCGDEQAFGEAVKEAFCKAEEKLLLSGTPWKSNGVEIPFVKYNGDGYAVGDYIYGVTEALRDDVVCRLAFEFHKGSVTNQTTGEVQHINENEVDEAAERSLSRLLSVSDSYVRELISASHRTLVECRKRNPDAAALAVCIDQAHAERMQKLIREVTGCKVEVIVSDDERATTTVSKFRNGHSEWLVSVGMISEGTDIPRLKVLCWMTNKVTQLLFRQICGRVSRRIAGRKDRNAYVFLPEDHRLVAFAKKFDELQVMATYAQEEDDSSLMDRTELQLLPDFVYSTDHHGSDLMMVQQAGFVPAREMELAKAFAMKTGCEIQEALEFGRAFGQQRDIAVAEVASDGEPEVYEHKLDRAKVKYNNLAERLANRKYPGDEGRYAKVHGSFGKKLGECTLAEVIDRIAFLTSELRSL
jgi:superfamily II DNA or RNA helicase